MLLHYVDALVKPSHTSTESSFTGLPNSTPSEDSTHPVRDNPTDYGHKRNRRGRRRSETNRNHPRRNDNRNDNRTNYNKRPHKSTLLERVSVCWRRNTRIVTTHELMMPWGHLRSGEHWVVVSLILFSLHSSGFAYIYFTYIYNVRTYVYLSIFCVCESWLR